MTTKICPQGNTNSPETIHGRKSSKSLRPSLTTSFAKRHVRPLHKLSRGAVWAVSRWLPSARRWVHQFVAWRPMQSGDVCGCERVLTCRQIRLLLTCSTVQQRWRRERSALPVTPALSPNAAWNCHRFSLRQRQNRQVNARRTRHLAETHEHTVWERGRQMAQSARPVVATSRRLSAGPCWGRTLTVWTWAATDRVSSKSHH